MNNKKVRYLMKWMAAVLTVNFALEVYVAEAAPQQQDTQSTTSENTTLNLEEPISIDFTFGMDLFEEEEEIQSAGADTSLLLMNLKGGMGQEMYTSRDDAEYKDDDMKNQQIIRKAFEVTLNYLSSSNNIYGMANRSGYNFYDMGINDYFIQVSEVIEDFVGGLNYTTVNGEALQGNGPIKDRAFSPTLGDRYYVDFFTIENVTTDDALSRGTQTMEYDVAITYHADNLDGNEERRYKIAVTNLHLIYHATSYYPGWETESE